MHRGSRPVTHELTDLADVLGDAPTENPGDRGVSLAFPEGGGKAWSCLLGSALMMFPSFGFQVASGLPPLFAYNAFLNVIDIS